YLSSTDRWMNSPGYLDGAADFARPILSACLECHTTYAQPYAGSANQYHREHMVLGVTCEKCHGPGKEHVSFHQANPDTKSPHAIVNPASMSAERSLELCQLCHGGDPIVEKQPPFSYRPGEPLSSFYEYAQADGSKAVSGIHTNTQLPRLKRSKCFELSESMTCLDCHNPHQFERGNMALFSQRCLNCHEMPDCGKFESLGESLADNCIDCHMQNLDMNDIKLISGDTKFVPKMRDHFITVWPEVSAAYERELDIENQ
ncbi:MAG: multiheme c-type cytochrome, partial [Planctomycetota bacterium]